MTDSINIETGTKIKVSRRPDIRQKVDDERRNIGDKCINLFPEEVNQISRDRVAAGLRQERIKNELKKAKDKSMTDELTQLYNRRWFNLELSKRIKIANRNNTSFWLITFDFDHFKWINDQYSHTDGDNILRIVKKLKAREEEPIARTGGEEFSQLIDGNLSKKDISSIITRYQKEMEIDSREKLWNRPRKEDGNPRITHATLSFGVVYYQPGETEDIFIRRADLALQKAKQSGRNKGYIAIPIDNKGVILETIETSCK